MHFSEQSFRGLNSTKELRRSVTKLLLREQPLLKFS